MFFSTVAVSRLSSLLPGKEALIFVQILPETLKLIISCRVSIAQIVPSNMFHDSVGEF